MIPAMSTSSDAAMNHGVLSATSLARFAVCSGVPVRRRRGPPVLDEEPAPDPRDGGHDVDELQRVVDVGVEREHGSRSILRARDASRRTGRTPARAARARPIPTIVSRPPDTTLTGTLQMDATTPDSSSPERRPGRPHGHPDPVEPAAHRVVDRRLQDRHPEDAAHHVAGAGDREHRERQPERVREPEHHDRGAPDRPRRS